MIEDPVFEELKKYKRFVRVEDYYTKEQIEEMRERLKKGISYLFKDGKLILK
jgi:hypothetical protein